MLKIAYSWLLNAQIEHAMIWISSWKLYFSPLLQPGSEVGGSCTGALAGCTPFRALYAWAMDGLEGRFSTAVWHAARCSDSRGHVTRLQ